MAKPKQKKKVSSRKRNIPVRKKTKNISPKEVRLRKKRKKLKELKRERHALHNRIYRRRQKLKSFKSEEELDTARRIVTQISTLQKNLGAINKKLGVPPKKILTDEQKGKIVEQRQEEVSANFEIDPTIYTKWEAQGHFDKQIESPKWKWFIIDGKRLNTNNIMDIDFEMDEFISKLTSRDGVLVFYNTTTNTVKYEKA